MSDGLKRFAVFPQPVLSGFIDFWQKCFLHPRMICVQPINISGAHLSFINQAAVNRREG
jgi:hypothetical protein